MDEVSSLNRTNLSRPGISRKRRGDSFTYVSPKQTSITSSTILKRIEALAIPPAWKNVWISPAPRDHIQAYGTDEQGKRQYLYHAHWVNSRSQQKFRRMVVLARSITTIRTQLTRILNSSTETNKDRAHALAVVLIDRYGLRIGGKRYLRQHGSRGVTTLDVKNVFIEQDKLTLSFMGKSKQLWTIDIPDKDLIKALKEFCRNRQRGRLLLWRNQDQNTWAQVSEHSLNTFIRQLSDEDFTAKDFRTLKASARFLFHLGEMSTRELDGFAQKRKRKTLEQSAAKKVAAELHNSVAVVRSHYIDPRILSLYQHGALHPQRSTSAAERTLSELLAQHR